MLRVEARDSLSYITKSNHTSSTPYNEPNATTKDQQQLFSSFLFSLANEQHWRAHIKKKSLP